MNADDTDIFLGTKITGFSPRIGANFVWSAACYTVVIADAPGQAWLIS
jgi:hypothetical protein